jgi:tRNA pseudouridine55 synthase
VTTVASGLVIIDKPAGWTSHDVVARVRRLAGTRRVGHAGTLDPMATGVLVLGVERATKLLTYLVGARKTYEGTIRFGISTATDDAEGETLSRTDASLVSDIDVERAFLPLRGEIQQVPSSVSAIKVDGKRSYARVRAGEEVALPARPVTVYQFDAVAARRSVVEGCAVVDVDVTVGCSSGTYVRALARDAGAALGVGAHLTMLRRTAVGSYRLDSARTLEQLGEHFSVMPLAQAARVAFPARELTSEEARCLAHGRRVAAVGLGEGPVAAFAPDGALVALVGECGPTAKSLLTVSPAG